MTAWTKLVQAMYRKNSGKNKSKKMGGNAIYTLKDAMRDASEVYKSGKSEVESIEGMGMMRKTGKKHSKARQGTRKNRKSGKK